MRGIAMHLTCPHCSTEYEVPDVALAAGSRRLRCDRCGHQWRQEALSVAPPETSNPVPPVPETFVAPEVPKPDHVTTENLPKFLTKRDPGGDLAEGTDEQGLTERRRGIAVESKPREPARKGRGPRGRMILLLVVLIIIAALFAYRSI